MLFLKEVHALAKSPLSQSSIARLLRIGIISGCSGFTFSYISKALL
jgi:hypothetical protein